MHPQVDAMSKRKKIQRKSIPNGFVIFGRNLFKELLELGIIDTQILFKCHTVFRKRRHLSQIRGQTETTGKQLCHGIVRWLFSKDQRERGKSSPGAMTIEVACLSQKA